MGTAPFAPAHEEWIIAHLGTAKHDDVPDEIFVSWLMKDLTVRGSPERRQVQGVLNKLQSVERSLNKSHVGIFESGVPLLV
jgi:hypothetical protein